MEKTFFVVGSVLAFLGTAAGAFGAHALKDKLSPELAHVFEVGVRYQMYHALALLAVAWAISRTASPLVSISGWLFLAGVIIFSGSLYVLALSGVRAWGAVTPVGGILLLLGWVVLVIGVLQR